MAMSHINTPTIADMVSKSKLIQSGSPAVYQLKPTKGTAGTLGRIIVGQRNPNKDNKTILLVGETGTGKSTLINALVNYIMGVKWGDDVWFQIVEDEKRGQSESQTSDVMVYQIFGFEGQTLPYSLTIIDTPGYGDTRGNEKDDIVGQRLLELFGSQNGVHEIHAVGLVLKATENRVSDRLRYIFDSVMSLFGQDMEKKIVALITHSDGVAPENVLQALEEANIRFAKDEENEPVFYLFNNRQTTQKTKKNRIALKSSWDFTMEEISQLAEFLQKGSAQNLRKTVEVLNSRIRLTACIQNLQERIMLTEHKQNEIQQTQEAMKMYEEEMKNNENFSIEVDEPYKAKENITDGGWWFWGWWNWEWRKLFYTGAVCCKACEETCHYPGCTVAPSPTLCEVMKDGRCTSCTGKCPVSDHVKEEWIYVTKTRKVRKTLEDVKRKYEMNKAGSQSQMSVLQNLQKEMDQLQAKKDQLLDESFELVVKLEQIALNADSLSTRVYLDFLIVKMKEKGDRMKVQKLEEMRSRVDHAKGKKEALRYGFNKAFKAFKEAMQ